MGLDKDGISDPVVCLLRSDPATLASLGLVLASMGIDYRIDEHRGQLLVAQEWAEAAAQQLQLYQQENEGWPPVRPTVKSHPPGAPTVLMMGAMVVLYLVTGPWSQQGDWFARGMVDAQAIMVRGEWWRLVSGLTLHADGVHLLGNCLLGGLLIHLLSTTVGYGVAWAMLLLTGALGNALNVLLRQAPHHSVGLSTAIFAVIGVFAAMHRLCAAENWPGGR